jgi:hypothetical protein
MNNISPIGEQKVASFGAGTRIPTDSMGPRYVPFGPKMYCSAIQPKWFKNKVLENDLACAGRLMAFQDAPKANFWLTGARPWAVWKHGVTGQRQGGGTIH